MTALLSLLLSLTPAWAEDPLPPGGMVQVLPMPDVIGDGKTPVTVHVLALHPDGSPMEDLSVKLKSKETKELSGWTHQGRGIYAFQVMPPEVKVPSRLFVRAKGKTADKLYSVDLSTMIPLRPTPPLAMSLSANPVELVSGERDEATLSFTLADGRNIQPENLRIRSSLGEIGELSSMGGGRFVARFNVSKVTQPGLALITVSDARRPDRIYGNLTIPVTVKKEIRVRAGRGSSVLLKVDGRDYGPVEAKGGYAKVPGVIVPPGITEGTQVVVKGDKTEESTFDLGVPTDRRLQLVPHWLGVPGDPDLEVTARVYIVTKDGSPDGSARPEVTCDGADVASVVHEGRGLYLITLRPHLTSTARDSMLKVSLPDEKGQTDELPVRFTPARPTSVRLSADPSPLGDARAATLTATLRGAGDGPLVDRTVAFNLTGAKAAGAPVLQDGTVTQAITTYGGPVEVIATVPTDPSGNAVHDLVILPTRSWLPSDTISSTMFTVAAVDVFGYPVAGVDLRLQLESGDGSLPEKATTDDHGLAQVFYTAGSGLRLVTVRAFTEEASAVASVLQGPVVLKGVPLPVSGPAARAALTQAWADSVSTLRIETE